MQNEKNEKHHLFESPFWHTRVGNILFVLFIITMAAMMILCGYYIVELFN